MITASLSRNLQVIRLIAYQEGLWLFKFTGDQTYTDSQSVVWTWQGVELIAPTILGIRVGAEYLQQVDSLADCKTTDGSWYYNSPTLYIHWENGAGDWSISRSSAKFQQAGNIDVADRFNVDTLNYSAGIFYAPTLNKISSFGFFADPLKLGITQSRQFTIDLDNSSGGYNNIDDRLASGSIMQVVDDGNIVITAITSDVKTDERAATISGVEQRFFYNPKVCQNVITIASYANVEDKYIGKAIHCIYGKVRNSKVTPINTNGLVKANSQTIRFLVSDPAIGALTSAGTLTMPGGYTATISGSDLNACWVEWTRPANSDIDLDGFTWSGQRGTSNGLEIIRGIYESKADYPYNDSLYDTTAWEYIQNTSTEAVGVTFYDDDTLLSKGIEPICTSLQCMIYTNEQGQLTAASRVVSKTTVANFEVEQMEGVSYQIISDSFVPEVEVVYSSEGDRSVIEGSYKESIIDNYGNVANGSINPIRTVLYNKTDAESLAAFLMELSKQPEKRIEFTVPYNPNLRQLRPFDNITANGDNIELYSVDNDIYTQRTRITGRMI